MGILQPAFFYLKSFTTLVTAVRRTADLDFAFIDFTYYKL